jgi:hypothetical protein
MRWWFNRSDREVGDGWREHGDKAQRDRRHRGLE